MGLSAMDTLDHVPEMACSIAFLIVGVWGTAFGYGLVSTKLVGGLRWRPEFRRPLRWLGPLLALLSMWSLVILLR